MTEKATPLEFLEAVYSNAELPLSVRMRAAQACLPFTHPKLAVTAVVSEASFAYRLEQAIERTARAMNGDAPTNRMIEAKPVQEKAIRRL